MQNQTLNIKQVVEVTHAQTVNSFLELGWVVINTVAEKEGDSGWIKYSLGWIKDEPAVRPKLY